MVDLQAWSQKLVDRGERIVMEVTGADRAAARAAIDAARGSVRTAIVVVKTGLSPEEALALLAKHDNRVRAILGDPPPVGEG
jgi:N-acetylmuramic acid 6-phosphate etherase